MNDSTLENRLNRFGDQLDAVADLRAARRAGTDQTLVELQDVRSRHRPTSRWLVAALVLVLIALAVFAVVRRTETSPASGEPQWERLNSHAVGFPRSITAGVHGVVDGRFIVLGGEHAWVSGNGREWKPVTVPKSLGANLVGVAQANGRTVAWSYLDGTSLPRLWSTRDGLRWTSITPRGLGSGIYLDIVGHGTQFVAIDAQTPGAWTSNDATHWQPATFQGTPPSHLGELVWFHGEFRAMGYDDPQHNSEWGSADGTHWHKIADTTPPPRLASLYAPPHAARLYGIQYETAGSTLEQGGSFGGRLMASRDGVTWTEVTSFHEQLPVANPDHILRTHGWWILSGNTGTPDGRRRTDIWMSRDLKHWSELPRHLQGKPGSGVGLPTAANGDTVIGTGLFFDHVIWIWEP